MCEHIIEKLAAALETKDPNNIVRVFETYTDGNGIVFLPIPPYATAVEHVETKTEDDTLEATIIYTDKNGKYMNKMMCKCVKKGRHERIICYSL